MLKLCWLLNTSKNSLLFWLLFFLLDWNTSISLWEAKTTTATKRNKPFFEPKKPSIRKKGFFFVKNHKNNNLSPSLLLIYGFRGSKKSMFLFVVFASHKKCVYFSLGEKKSSEKIGYIWKFKSQHSFNISFFIRSFFNHSILHNLKMTVNSGLPTCNHY